MGKSGINSNRGVHGAWLSRAQLSPRLRQVLDRLLRGDSEKQLARRLKVSPATAHQYVVAVYRHYTASSRGELMARFIQFPE